MQAILGRSVPVAECAAAVRYLTARGLGELGRRNDWPPGLRALDSLPYWEAGPGGNAVHLGDYPALVAPVVSLSGDLLSLHRTYLTAEGAKAPVRHARKLMAPVGDASISGGAIQLYPACSGNVLAVAEGIETALAVRASCPDLPVWSCVSARMLEAVRVSASVVYIFADKDRSEAGQSAAAALAERLAREAVRAHICLPPGPIPEGRKGLDWLDVYLDGGASV